MVVAKQCHGNMECIYYFSNKQNSLIEQSSMKCMHVEITLIERSSMLTRSTIKQSKIRENITGKVEKGRNLTGKAEKRSKFSHQNIFFNSIFIYELCPQWHSIHRNLPACRCMPKNFSKGS